MKKHLPLLTLLLALLMLVTTMPAFGAEKKGVVKEDDLVHIYSNVGKLVKNKPVYKVKSDGKIQYYHIDKDGAAKRYTGVEALAAKQLCKLKAGGKKSEKNLKKAFKWAASLEYKNNTRSSLKGDNAAKYYGRYGFTKKKGDCSTVAYAFYWMAKVLGYPVKAIQGYAGTTSNNHAWTTIRFGNTTYVFDPHFNRSYAGQLAQTKRGVVRMSVYCGYKVKYGAPNTYDYFNEKKEKIS